MQANFCHPNQPNFPYPRSRFLVIPSISDTPGGFLGRKGSEPSSELQGDMAFHDASARFGGRRGCVEGIGLYARMHGLPLTPLVVRYESGPAISSCRDRYRPNQDRVSHVLVKGTRREILPRDAFLRNAFERRHLTPSRGGVRGPPPLRGALRLERRDDPLTWPPTSTQLPFFIRPRSFRNFDHDTFRCPNRYWYLVLPSAKRGNCRTSFCPLPPVSISPLAEDEVCALELLEATTSIPISATR